MEELLAHEHPMQINLQPVTALQLISLIQLAMRHPGVTGSNRELADRLLQAARQYFAACPAVLKTIAMGEDQAFDHQSPSITCPRCGATSYNLNDVKHRYCGACHQFHDDPAVN
jgi:ribosomal protein L37E